MQVSSAFRSVRLRVPFDAIVRHAHVLRDLCWESASQPRLLSGARMDPRRDEPEARSPQPAREGRQAEEGQPAAAARGGLETGAQPLGPFRMLASGPPPASRQEPDRQKVERTHCVGVHGSGPSLAGSQERRTIGREDDRGSDASPPDRTLALGRLFIRYSSVVSDIIALPSALRLVFREDRALWSQGA